MYACEFEISGVEQPSGGCGRGKQRGQREEELNGYSKNIYCIEPVCLI
jgi:hypothetical protein